METILISDAERFFITQGVQLGHRLDGRGKLDFRPIGIETGILNHTAGSARIKIGNTVVIACVSVEVGTPSINSPNEGRMEIDIECSPTATPKFTGKSGSEIADILMAILSAAFNQECLQFKHLCIQPGKQCWIIHTDVLLLESDGNLLDAASLAIIAAMGDLQLPISLLKQIKTEAASSGGEASFIFSTTKLPTFITIHKVGNSFIVDADKEEEACSFSRVFVAVRADGAITTVIKEGCGSILADSLVNMLEIGQSKGKEIHSALALALQQERKLKALQQERKLKAPN